MAVFKYYNFLNANLSHLIGAFGYKNHIPYLSMLLPIGLSFHTFQAMSYTIEVYRGKQKPEKHFGIYALYVMFFPQLVAGPIERPQNMLHQFHEKHDFDYYRIVSGLKIMLWGFVKKVVVADRLAIYVNTVYSHPDKHSAITLAVATIFFSFQIYCDFSGYSDIAVGTAKVLGYNLMLNFRRPYFAKDIREFWSRWHISLSTWFRDYLYIPLGGNRVSVPRWYLNLFIVFVVSGLWHGANWTFIIWGALHGCFIVLGLIIQKISPKKFAVPGFINVLITFVLVSFAWIFFRANNIHDAFTVARSILIWKKGPFFVGDVNEFSYSIFALVFLLLVEFKQEYFNTSFSLLYNNNKLVRQFAYVLLLLMIITIGVFNGGQFIYFQF
ncbi:MAG TPA: MBOAT family O-acyltransferase [Flavipsychrobacter sp.]|nr:MBOAT family O-acyltransferase [Flavipsychrobacter sp.]